MVLNINFERKWSYLNINFRYNYNFKVQILWKMSKHFLVRIFLCHYLMLDFATHKKIFNVYKLIITE